VGRIRLLRANEPGDAEVEDLDEVEPSLPALVLRDEGLRPSEQDGELGLGDARRMASLDEPFAEPAIGRAED